MPEVVEFNVLCNCKGETQSGTRGREQGKVKKRCGEKQRSDKMRAEAVCSTISAEKRLLSERR